MTNKILNVLEEIKKLRVENSNKSNIVINPTRFASDIDKVANATKAYTENIYGSKPDHFSSHTSSYKDSIRTVDHLSQFKHNPDVSNSTYFSNFYGIPKIKEMSNNDNTLYYEKGLGKQTEFDYAVNNMGSEMDKQAGLQHIISTMRNKKSTPINVSQVVEKAKAAKASKAAATAAAVTVAPAVEVATTEPVTVAPAFSGEKKKILEEAKSKMDKIRKSETTKMNFEKMIKGVKMNNTLAAVIDAQSKDVVKQSQKHNLMESLNKLKVPELEELYKTENVTVPKGNKHKLIKQLVKYRKENAAKFSVAKK
jgi:hypothetical protein